MYLRGSKWSFNKRTRRRPSAWRISLLVVLIAAGLYINQVVVPATPPLFLPTATPTRSPESVINQAQEYFDAGKISQAVDAYKQAIEVDPTNAAVYTRLAQLQVFAGDYETAILNTQNALLKNPNNPTAHAVQGWALGYLGRYSEAELELKKALNLDPNSALAHAYYAEVLINQRDYEKMGKAGEESKAALALDPNLFEAHRARGIVLMNTGADNLPYAVDEFKAALAINKNIADVHLYLGITYKGLGQLDLAEEELLNAYSYNPTDTDALTEIARSYFADGKYRQAAQFAEEAVKVKPADARLHGNLGIMIYKNEEFSKAIPELELAVRGGTTADGVVVDGLPLDYDIRIMEYYWYYGFALQKSNRCRDAVPIFTALLEGVPNDETAVYNANAGLEACSAILSGTPWPPTATPEPES